MASQEDVELCQNNAAAGVQLSFAPDAIMFHEYQQGLRGMYTQFRKYGAVEPQIAAKHISYLQLLGRCALVPCSASAAFQILTIHEMLASLHSFVSVAWYRYLVSQ